jgi:hypothetical protein
MKNPARKNNFEIVVDGAGTFRFNRKHYGAQIRIDATVARILGPNGGSVEQDAVMRTHADLVGCYNALMVDCPPGWEDLEEMDLSEDPDKEAVIFNLYVALKEKLDSFRVAQGTAGAAQAGVAAGAGDAQDDAVLGAESLPGAAD